MTTDATGITLDQTASDNNTYGFTITPIREIFLTSFTKDALATNCIAKIQTSGGTDIAQASFTGNTATFTGTIILSAGTTYRAVLVASGSMQQRRKASEDVSYPLVKTNISYTGRVYASGGIVSITSTATATSSSVNVGTGTIGTRFVNKDWPIARGLTAGSTKHLVDSHDYDADTD